MSRLTEREKEVLQLMASGCTTKVIAFRLSVEFTTIVEHRKSIIGKMGCRNGFHAVAVAVRNGLIR